MSSNRCCGVVAELLLQFIPLSVVPAVQAVIDYGIAHPDADKKDNEVCALVSSRC